MSIHNRNYLTVRALLAYNGFVTRNLYLEDKMLTDGSKQLVLTVAEASKLLRISRGAAYEAIKQGQIPAVRVGRRLLVPRASLERLLDGKGKTLE